MSLRRYNIWMVGIGILVTSWSCRAGWGDTLSTALKANPLTAVAAPVAKFFGNFSQNLFTALSNAQFNDRTMLVYSPPQATTGGVTYGIAYDFGFRGAGQVEMPIGFSIDRNNRYIYTPVEAAMLPGVIPDITDPTGNTKKPLSLGSGIAPSLIKGLLGIFLGGKDNAEKAWAPIGYFTVLKPESVFFLKIITLINSAGINTRSGRGYPKLVDVPYELLILLFRLGITPDIISTVEANGGIPPEKSYRWKTIKTVSKPSVLAQRFPDVLLNMLNQIKPKIDKREVQEYQDRDDNVITDMMKWYSQMRQVKPYEKRLEFILSDVLGRAVLDIDKKLKPADLYKDGNTQVKILIQTRTDADLLNYAVRQALAERCRGFEAFIQPKETGSEQSYFDQEAKTNAFGDMVVTADELSVDPNADTEVVVVNVHRKRVLRFIQARLPKIQAFIDTVLDKYTDLLSDSTIAFLKERKTTIPDDFNHVSALAEDLKQKRLAIAAEEKRTGTTLDITSDLKQAEQTVAEDLINYIKQLEEEDQITLAALSNDSMELPLFSYLDVKYSQIMRIVQERFAGDIGFLFDDSRISKYRGMLVLVAILFRANLDLTYMENWIRSDPQKFINQAQKKDQQLVAQCVASYKKFADAETYMMYTEKTLADYKAKLSNMTPQQYVNDPQFKQLDLKSSQAATLYRTTRAELRFYLRQYEFDRTLPRKKRIDEVFVGESSLEGLSDLKSIQLNLPDAGADKSAVAAAPASSATSAMAPSSTTTPAPGAASTTAPAGTTSSAAPASSGSVVDQTIAAQQKYGYARSVNQFLLRECAFLLLRSPELQQTLTQQKSGSGGLGVDQICYSFTGSNLSDLIDKSVGMKDEIAVEVGDDNDALNDNLDIVQPTANGDQGAAGSNQTDVQKFDLAKIADLEKQLFSDYGQVVGQPGVAGSAPGATPSISASATSATATQTPATSATPTTAPGDTAAVEVPPFDWQALGVMPDDLNQVAQEAQTISTQQATGGLTSSGAPTTQSTAPVPKPAPAPAPVVTSAPTPVSTAVSTAATSAAAATATQATLPGELPPFPQELFDFNTVTLSPEDQKLLDQQAQQVQQQISAGK